MWCLIIDLGIKLIQLPLQLGAELFAKEVEPGVAISSLSGVLVTRDNKMTLNSYARKKS